MRARHLRFPLAGLLAWLVACVGLGSAASAATITVRTDRWGDSATYYVAGAGERNDVIVVLHDGNVTVTDLGATVTPVGSRCRSVRAQRAVCRGELMTAHISVGDMDDRVATTQNIGTDADMVVHGGPGNDVVRGGVNEDSVLNGDDGNDEIHGGGGMDDLRGGDGNDVLDGGEDDDTLDGGPGADRVYGGDGEDELDGGGGQDQLFGGRGRDWLTDGDRDRAPGDAAPGPDTLVGGGNGSPGAGPEGDTLSYQRRSQAVSVHAGVDGNAGEPGEHDSVSGIESIVGGAGDDLLVGDQTVNYLDGRGGADILIGGGGEDNLAGGRGGDRLLGGRDPDSISGGAGIDTLDCGTPRADRRRPGPPALGQREAPHGDDLLTYRGFRAREMVPNSCEQLRFDPGRFPTVWLRPHPTRTRPWWLRLHTACPNVFDDAYVACRGTITVRERRGQHRLLAIGSFRHDNDGAQFAVPLALTSLGYNWRAGRLGRAPATVALRMIAEATPRRPFKWTIRA